MKGATLGHRQEAVSSKATTVCSIPEEATGFSCKFCDTWVMLQTLCLPQPHLYICSVCIMAIPHGEKERLQSSSISACDLALQSC